MGDQAFGGQRTHNARFRRGLLIDGNGAAADDGGAGAPVSGRERGVHRLCAGDDQTL